MDLFGKSPRPVFNKEMMRKLSVYTADLLNVSSVSDDELESIEEVLDRNQNADGFELGKKFERDGYDVDANTVAELDSVSCERDDILREYIKEWVKQDNIIPMLPLGISVNLPRKLEGETSGMIVGYNEDVAQYRVRINGQNENSAYIFDYEVIEKINNHETSN